MVTVEACSKTEKGQFWIQEKAGVQGQEEAKKEPVDGKLLRKKTLGPKGFFLN